jgi:SAM-dependent methyltransferase
MVINGFIVGMFNCNIKLGFKMSRIVQYADLVIRCQTGEYLTSYCCKFDQVVPFLKKGSKILLLGCGNGEEVRYAIDLGYDAYGVTLNLIDITVAKEKYHVDLVIADMHSLPFETGMFDAVASWQTLEHSYAPLFYFLECNRVLKEGGLVFTESPSPASGTSFDGKIHHILCCNIIQIKSLLLQANFKNVQVGTDFDGLKLFDNNNSTVYGIGVKKSLSETKDYFKGTLYVD